MKTFLFLDDERHPRDVSWINIGRVGPNAPWQIVRSFDEAVSWVKKNGFPNVVSFDHDLGLDHYHGDFSDGKSGLDFAKWLVEYDIDTASMPDDFVYTVHSKNPVGSKNIKTYLDNYIRFKASQ